MNNQFFLNKGGTTGDYTVDVDDSSISDLLPKYITSPMARQNFNDSYSNTLLLDFLKKHFDENLFTNYRNRGLYIAAQDVKPIFVDKEDAFDLSASDIFNSIKFYLDTLIPSDNTLDQFSLSFKNNIIIYCDRNYDIENSISIQLYTRFGYNVIKIYNTHYLYVSYINQQMPVKGVIDDIRWLPIQSVYQTTYVMKEYKVRYNKIIEVIMKLYFSILDIHFKNINMKM